MIKLKHFKIALCFAIYILFFSDSNSQVKENKDSLVSKKENNDSLKVEKEEEEAETEEIIITGTRIPERIIDVPFSVFRVDKKELAYTRNVGLKDVLADVPGLFLQSRFGGTDVRVSIRGYGNRSNAGIRGIRVLQDGIPESEPDGEANIDAIDFTSLETVEVAKGNFSSLYTNAPGGVINFISDMTFKTNYVKQTNMFGGYGLRQNGVKLGLMTKNYKFYQSYSYRNYNGFREHNNEYINLSNTVFQIYPDSRTTVSILSNFAKGSIQLPGALTVEEYETDPFMAYPVAVSSDFKRIVSKGKLAVRYNTSFGQKIQNDIEVTGYMRLSDIQFTTNVLYTYNSRYLVGGLAKYDNKSKIFSQKNLFSVGLDYNYVSADIASYNNVGGIKGDELQAQNLEVLDNFGAYFQNQFYIYKDKSSISLSGRYDNIEITNDNQLFGFQNSTRTFSNFTPRIALNYKFTPLIAAYTSYGYGYDSPTAIELENYPYTSNNGQTTLNPDLNPQDTKNFELGIKGNVFTDADILEKSYFEVTFYNTKIQNEIVPFVINDRTYFRNAGNTNRTGVESGFKFEMFDGFELVTNYSYSDFNYDDYTAINYTAVGDTLTADFSGNEVPAIPTSIFNFIFNYQFKITNIYTGILLWDMDYISNMFADDANTVVVPSYFYGNIMAGVTINYKNFYGLFTSGVKNIFNEKYVGFVNVNANPELQPSERRYYETGEPRNYYFGVNLGYQF
ncbi:MAG: TonB-dependent receptor [Bacteroidota bacterium]|nr:TonB-dependent receptor [Bacteroidota bacterium]